MNLPLVRHVDSIKMQGTYDPSLVLLSLCISLMASWVAVDLASRIVLQRTTRRRLLWLCLGAFALGIGIWSMHYVGMLAYRVNMPVLYDWPTVLLSMLAAVLASGLALYLVSGKTLTWTRTALGSLLMGGGIASMHYIGMAAMRMPAALTYFWPLVLLSVGVAVTISFVALRLTFSNRATAAAFSAKKLASTLLIGFAIPVMHYVGMAAMRWREGPGRFAPADLRHAIAISHLGALGVILVTGLVLVLAIVSAGFDRLMVETEQRKDLLDRHSNRLQDAFRANGVGIWECDPATGLFYVDARLRDMYDVPQDGGPVPRELWKQRVHPGDLLLLDQRWAEALESGDKYENEYRVLRRGGALCRYRTIASIVRQPDGRVGRVIGMTWDVTNERRQEEEAADQAERFRMTLEAIGDAVISTDEEHRVTFLNRAASQLTGWSLEEGAGKLLDEVFTTREGAAETPCRNPVLRCLEANNTLLVEDAVLLSRDGRRYNITEHVSVINGGRAAVLTFRDVTLAQRMERELQYAATHDALTGLPNRTAFKRRLQELWDATRSTDRTHCLCIVDLDRFKIINDTSGHMAGDGLLKEVADILQHGIRPGDLAARMGGDEFMLLLVDSTTEQGETCAARLLGSIASLRFPWGDRTYDITASLGLVAFGSASPDPEILISQADVATFTSKHDGRNRVSVYLQEQSGAAGDHQEMAVVADLRRAIEENRFELYAQPIVPTASPENPSSFELLLRMRNQRGDLVAPSVFIPAAERYGLMRMVDQWVIRHALRSYSLHCAGSFKLHFALNLSAESLSDENLWPFVEAQFAEAGVPPSCITFEITESGLIRNFAHARNFIGRAQAAGCRIALDDFGTGLSSLSYLKQFSLDILKVDGSFCQGLASNSLDRSIVRAIAEIAHSMNASTVAECVEDRETIELLARLGVDQVQGWATGKPVPMLSIFPATFPLRPAPADHDPKLEDLVAASERTALLRLGAR